MLINAEAQRQKDYLTRTNLSLNANRPCRPKRIVFRCERFDLRPGPLHIDNLLIYCYSLIFVLMLTLIMTLIIIDIDVDIVIDNDIDIDIDIDD